MSEVTTNGFGKEGDANPTIEESRFSIFTLLKKTYLSISKTAFSILGIGIFLISFFLVFRHDGFLSNISYLELAWFFWIYFCFSRIKSNVGLINKAGFRHIVGMFYFTGVIGFWISIALFLLSIKSLIFSKTSFWASNTVEFGLMLIVFLGFGISAFWKSRLYVIAEKDLRK